MDLILKKNKKIFFCANNFFVLYNFRFKIIQKYVLEGYDVHLIAEEDGYEKNFFKLIIKSNIFSFKKKNIVFDFFNFIFINLIIFFKSKNSVFYTFTAKANILYGLLNFQKKQTIVANITGLGIILDYKILEPFFKLVLFLALKNAKIIFVQNQRDFSIFKKLMHSTKVKIIKLHGSGVNLEVFSNKNNSRNFKKLNFAMVSRLKDRKGYKNYLEACEYLSKKNIVNCSFQFVPGYGSNEIILQEMNSKYKNVQIIPFHSDINKFLRKIDCIVYPSFYNEGTPKILLEALASGCAIITTNQPGCINTIKDGVNGFIISDTKLLTIANAIEKYCKLNLEQKQSFSKESRFIAESRFDEKLIIDKYFSTLT
tara:strand:+ start:1851 stop:2957 length:1107 start_codon:yes stop_codon:yes gene_type:complete